MADVEIDRTMLTWSTRHDAPIDRCKSCVVLLADAHRDRYPDHCTFCSIARQWVEPQPGSAPAAAFLHEVCEGYFGEIIGDDDQECMCPHAT